MKRITANNNSNLFYIWYQLSDYEDEFTFYVLDFLNEGTVYQYKFIRSKINNFDKEIPSVKAILDLAQDHTHTQFDNLEVDNFSCNGDGHVYLNNSNDVLQIKPNLITLTDMTNTSVLQINKESVKINNDPLLTKSQIIDLFYPVGSIYTSMNSTNPSQIFGGTWKQITDKFLYCTSSSKKEGGSKKITSSNLPAHSHSISLNTSSSGNHSHTFAGTPITGEFSYDTSAGYISDSDTYKAYSGCFSKGTARNKKPSWDENGFSSHGVKFSATPSGTINSTGAHTHNVSGNTGNSGSGSDYLPPYITVYAWYREA